MQMAFVKDALPKMSSYYLNNNLFFTFTVCKSGSNCTIVNSGGVNAGKSHYIY